MSDHCAQITFNFREQEAFRFDNFVVGKNQGIIEQLQHQLDSRSEPLLYLWGEAGTGCSHLLQAACQHANQAGCTAIYLPMDKLQQSGSAILEGIEGIDLICLDHLDSIAGIPLWEEGMFHFFNRVLQKGTRLLVGALSPPRRVGIGLADLLSRFTSCAVFQLMPLEDTDLERLLQEKAVEKGIILSQEAVQYILSRSQSKADVLLKILENLDDSSLSAGRKLTIPFIKQSMGW